jgi:hypothetical protein
MARFGAFTPSEQNFRQGQLLAEVTRVPYQVAHAAGRKGSGARLSRACRRPGRMPHELNILRSSPGWEGPNGIRSVEAARVHLAPDEWAAAVVGGATATIVDWLGRWVWRLLALRCLGPLTEFLLPALSLLIGD